MKATEALKNRIEKASKLYDIDKKPSLLDILRERNRDREIREDRRMLLRRIGKP